EIRESPTLSDVDYRIAKRFLAEPHNESIQRNEGERQTEHAKASVRSKVEHPFPIVKRMFHAGKTRYRGLRKNPLLFHLLFASASLVMCLRAERQREFCMTMG
ncbi:transposase, partial [uncultured Mitsuokella sp.]|uniref:transposase n=1 Tax=uncultured Mitsuokella sp. TaxID=453120 RepID=UPI002634E111